MEAAVLTGGTPLCLNAQVKDDKRKCTLGNLTVPLSILLTKEHMTLTQCFPLKNSGPSSTIKLKMALRVKNEHVCIIDLRVIPFRKPAESWLSESDTAQMKYSSKASIAVSAISWKVFYEFFRAFKVQRVGFSDL